MPQESVQSRLQRASSDCFSVQPPPNRCHWEAKILLMTISLRGRKAKLGNHDMKPLIREFRLQAACLCAVILFGGAFLYVNQRPRCNHCGLNVKTTDHEYTCTKPGCNAQWNCLTQNSHFHCPMPTCQRVFDDLMAHRKKCELCGMEYFRCQEHKCPFPNWDYSRSDPTSVKGQDQKLPPIDRRQHPAIDKTATDR